MKATLVVMLLFSFFAPLAHGAVIDFEKFPGPDGYLGTPDDVPIVAPAFFIDQQQQITDQYATLGIRFLPNPADENKNEIVNDSTFTRSAGSRQNLLSTFRNSYPFGPIEARFTIPVYSLRMAIGLQSSSNVLDIYDSNSNLIDSVTGLNQFVTLTSSVPIDRFRVTGRFSVNQAAIDDIEFISVPEPASALVALFWCAMLPMFCWNSCRPGAELGVPSRRRRACPGHGLVPSRRLGRRSRPSDTAESVIKSSSAGRVCDAPNIDRFDTADR